MREAEMKGKIFSVAVAVLMVGLMVGGLASTGHLGNAQSVLSDSAQVYLYPQDSSAPFCETRAVEIRVNAANFQAGQIKLIYNLACANVTDWLRNSTDFPLGTWDSDISGEEWITFSAIGPLSGDHLIGTLTIHCTCEEECITALDFVEGAGTGSALFDSLGSVIPAIWTDGTFQCTEVRPDLVIQKTAKWAAGMLTVNYTVTNIGTAAAGPSVTCVYIDDTHMAGCDSPVPGLAVGGVYSATASCLVDCPCDTAIEVKVCADNYDAVAERDESNNCEVNIVDCPLCSSNEVYFSPQHSRAAPCRTTDVEIRVNATEFMGGQINFTYNSVCANVTNWERNTADFPLGTWESGTPGEEWITFTALEELTGDYLIGTLTIRCVDCVPEEECTTVLDFIEDGMTESALFDSWGSGIPATWTDGTVECKGLCGDVAPCPDCDYTVNMGDVILLLSYVGHPGEYELCCEFCGDVAPCPDSDGTINMGDVILLLSYVGHPGQYELCCG